MYTTPANTWSFVPPVPADNLTSSSPFFDLSTFIADEDSGIDITLLLKGIIASAMQQYSTTAIAMPWDVGKTLLQVQWVPRDAGEVPPSAVLTTDVVDEDGDLSDSSNENDSYFADPTNPESASLPPRLADERGYVVRQSVLEEGTIPEYTIPVGNADGTWGMMKRLGRFRGEGWLALWKGLLTSTVTNALTASLQPVIHSMLQTILTPMFPSLSSPLSSSMVPIVLPVASHVVTGFLLSPLDLIRTRLIVQSSIPRYRTYSGPIDALFQIIEHEGGWKGMYLHPHLLIPTLLDCTLRSLVPLTLPGLVASYLGFGAQITPETSPFIWTVAELLGTCAGFIITVPFETVRRRLQAQVRGSAKPIKACVELRPSPYNGVVDTFWHILTEERSDMPLKTRRRRRKSISGKSKGKGKAREAEAEEEVRAEGESWLRNTGIGQLYRGLGIRVGASVFVFVLSLFSGVENNTLFTFNLITIHPTSFIILGKRVDHVDCARRVGASANSRKLGPTTACDHPRKQFDQRITNLPSHHVEVVYLVGTW
ncbi:Mitochondrial fusion and transport protein ugo1 [Grifola frondosa]|uniref:Mitochondrial fusion and transport protein ugo1 n=1 Tax=Grifola frondosa TaxID=5627 RepID=A0A1C7MSX0_GRIFR|nr:Mitochondrial fusion and transport protein ugo1 [Grifola frondosa]